MAIELYTGQPGNGKTVQLMKRLLAEASKGERPIFASGVDGLARGLATDLPDARKWNEVASPTGGECNCTAAPPGHLHVVPDGAIIFIDEAWKDFGHLQDATRQATPAHVLALAEHRHRGLDFVWTTQMPNQLFPFLRGLIGSHTHVVRRFGTRFVDLFTWGELQEDVKSAGKREVAQRTTTTLDKSTFDKYKSATLHTVKRRIPLKVMALPLLIVAAVGIGYVAYQKMKPDAITERITGEKASAAGTAAPPSSESRGKAPVYRTAVEYVEAFTPRIAAMPWTAPAYDGRPVVAKPVALCVKSGAGLDGNGEFRRAGCHCRTEQGTVYLMSRNQCAAIVQAGGVYNPFLEPQVERQASRATQPGAGQRPAAMAAPAAAPVRVEGSSATGGPMEGTSGAFGG